MGIETWFCPLPHGTGRPLNDHNSRMGIETQPALISAQRVFALNDHNSRMGIETYRPSAREIIWLALWTIIIPGWELKHSHAHTLRQWFWTLNDHNSRMGIETGTTWCFTLIALPLNDHNSRMGIETCSHCSGHSCLRRLWTIIIPGWELKLFHIFRYLSLYQSFERS